jgi:hypothetical protein
MEEERPHAARREGLFVNLILAVCWLLMAVVLFGLLWTSPDAPYARLGHTGLPTAIVPVIFFFYNLVRWWAIRNAEQRRRMLSQPLGRRRYRRDSPERERTPDPTFDFSDKPLPPPPPGSEPKP